MNPRTDINELKKRYHKADYHKTKREYNYGEYYDSLDFPPGAIDKTQNRLKVAIDEINFIRLDFLDDIQKRIIELKNEGVTAKTAVDRLYTEVIESDKLVKLENKEGQKLWDLFKSISQYSSFEDNDSEKYYMWVLEDGTHQDINHCKGCTNRNGVVKKYKEWEKLGLPGSGVTECDCNCLCSLQEVEPVDSKQYEKQQQEQRQKQQEQNEKAEKERDAIVKKHHEVQKQAESVLERIKDTKKEHEELLKLYEKYGKEQEAKQAKKVIANLKRNIADREAKENEKDKKRTEKKEAETKKRNFRKGGSLKLFK